MRMYSTCPTTVGTQSLYHHYITFWAPEGTFNMIWFRLGSTIRGSRVVLESVGWMVWGHPRADLHFGITVLFLAGAQCD